MTQVMNDATVAQLSETFRGRVLRPSDEHYEEAKKVYNAMYYGRRPAVIAGCTGVADVISALRFARDNDLEVAVRGGGHSVAGYSISDGGVVIDLRPMKGMRVDPSALTARAQAGLTWGEFDRETQAFGLATTGGRVTTTGISGLTLGSGSGWLERKFGFVFDNLLSVDVVTADGRLVTASATENEDLFFGLRGGGGNFGIATSFEYRLHQLGPVVLGGMLVHRREHAPEVVRAWRDVMDSAPDELCGAVAFLTAPPEPFVPEDLQLKPAVGIIVLYAGPLDEAESAVRPLREIGSPVVELVAPMPYTFVQTLLDGGNPPGRHQYWKSENAPEFPDDAIDVFIDHANSMTSPFSVMVIEPKCGAISRVSGADMPLGGRDAWCTYYGFAAWEDPAQSDEHIEWARGFAAGMQPFAAAGVALNFTSDEGEGRVRSTFGDNYDRLVALKRKYDPDNVFHLNQNIKPD